MNMTMLKEYYELLEEKNERINKEIEELKGKSNGEKNTV
jgi:hypothetical protein